MRVCECAHVSGSGARSHCGRRRTDASGLDRAALVAISIQHGPRPAIDRPTPNRSIESRPAPARGVGKELRGQARRHDGIEARNGDRLRLHIRLSAVLSTVGRGQFGWEQQSPASTTHAHLKLERLACWADRPKGNASKPGFPRHGPRRRWSRLSKLNGRPFIFIGPSNGHGWALIGRLGRGPGGGRPGRLAWCTGGRWPEAACPRPGPVASTAASNRPALAPGRFLLRPKTSDLGLW